jgi:hypothetical protein
VHTCSDEEIRDDLESLDGNEPRFNSTHAGIASRLIITDAVVLEDEYVHGLGIVESFSEVENDLKEDNIPLDQSIDDISSIGSVDQPDLNDVLLKETPLDDFESAPASENADEILPESTQQNNEPLEPTKEPGISTVFYF